MRPVQYIHSTAIKTPLGCTKDNNKTRNEICSRLCWSVEVEFSPNSSSVKLDILKRLNGKSLAPQQTTICHNSLCKSRKNLIQIDIFLLIE